MSSAPSFDDADFEVAAPPQYGHAGVQGVLLEQEVDGAKRQLQIRQLQVLEKRRQNGAADRQPVTLRVDGEPETRLHELKHYTGRPRLRRTGHRVQRRRFARAS